MENRNSKHQQRVAVALCLAAAISAAAIALLTKNVKLPRHEQPAAQAQRNVADVAIPETGIGPHRMAGSPGDANLHKERLEAIRRDDEGWARQGFVSDGASAQYVQFEKLRTVFQLYHEKTGSFPPSEPNAMVGALAGNNPQKVRLISDKSNKRFLNDGYGTPLIFKFGRTRNAIEIRSAGADRRHHTKDDLVVGNADAGY